MNAARLMKLEKKLLLCRLQNNYIFTDATVIRYCNFAYIHLCFMDPKDSHRRPIHFEELRFYCSWKLADRVISRMKVLFPTYPGKRSKPFLLMDYRPLQLYFRFMPPGSDGAPADYPADHEIVPPTDCTECTCQYGPSEKCYFETLPAEKGLRLWAIHDFFKDPARRWELYSPVEYAGSNHAALCKLGEKL